MFTFIVTHFLWEWFWFYIYSSDLKLSFKVNAFLSKSVWNIKYIRWFLDMEKIRKLVLKRLKFGKHGIRLQRADMDNISRELQGSTNY